jgi:hypothetical protein
MAEEPTEDMTYMVSLSGGVGSAVAAERARASLWQTGTALVELRAPRGRGPLSLHAGHCQAMVAARRACGSPSIAICATPSWWQSKR